MHLSILTDALDLARKKYELTADDLAILQEVGISQRGEEATIMKIVKRPYVSSKATIHARIKRLCVREFLIKTEQKENMRCKTLAFGPKAVEFIQELETL